MGSLVGRLRGSADARRVEMRKKLGWEVAHGKAMNMAQLLYDQLKDQSTVFTRNGDSISAATPDREAWDEYWDVMRGLGFSAWDYDGAARFDRDLRK